MLFCYNVTPNNSLTLIIDGRSITFTRSAFERQNVVFPALAPSLCSMDMMTSVLGQLGAHVEEADSEFRIRSERPAYFEGMKQLVAHYIGIRNLIARDESFVKFRVLDELMMYSLFTQSSHVLEENIRLFYFGA